MPDYESPPPRPGVYTFHGADGSVLYIGKARSLRSRIRSYFRQGSGESRKRSEIARRVWSITWKETGSELEALLLEYLRIRRNQPPLNRQAEVHPRRRGEWRRACALITVPSCHPDRIQVCLVAGEEALAEITLSWLARHGDKVSRIDLKNESPGLDLMRRVRSLLGEPADSRVKIV